MLISSKDILIETPRIKFNKISSHPVIWSRWHMKLTISDPFSPKLCSHSQHQCTCLLSHFSRVWLFPTLWAIACQASLSLGFSRQKYWSRLPCPLQGIFPIEGLKLRLLNLLQWEASSLPLTPPGKPPTPAASCNSQWPQLLGSHLLFMSGGRLCAVTVPFEPLPVNPDLPK